MATLPRCSGYTDVDRVRKPQVEASEACTPCPQHEPEAALKVSTMRSVDHWLGVPACAALTPVRRIADAMSGHRHAAPPTRIVFLKLAEQGSTVLAAGAFRRAISMVGREHVYFLCFEENRFILDAMELIPAENVITIRTGSLLTIAGGTLSALRRLRRLGVDTVIDLEFFARSTAVLSALSGAGHRVGFQPTRGEGPYRGNLLTHRVRFNPHLHSSQSFQLLVEALEAPRNQFPTFDRLPPAGDLAPPPFRPDAAEIDDVRALIADAAGNPHPAPLILLNPNCSDLLPLRAWPPDRYVELAQRLLKRVPRLWIGLTGGPGEEAAVEALAARVASPRCVSLAGRTSMRQLLVLYHLAEVLVTNDSGPAQFAAMTPIHTVTLFGPEHPRLFAARNPRNQVVWAGIACSPCISALNDRTTDCRDNRCMQRIEVETVEDAVLRALTMRERGEERPPLELEVLPAGVARPSGR